MNKDADRIAQDIKDIVQTRIAIAEKLGAIEQHVGSTMQHARTMMTQVADKTTSSVHETLKATKEVFDPQVHVARHPWVFVGGTLILGYAVGALYRRGWRIDGAVPYYPRGAKGAAVMPMSGSPSSERQESGVYPFYPSREADSASEEQGRPDRLTLWTELERVLQDELGVVRSGFVRFGRGLLHEMLRQAVPALVQIIAGNRRERAPRSEHDPRR
ncbi:MAG TPA: hypothetical protein VK901_12505 [Nitrospiraceae bacterium]|nr:hypothetical protein [Nitrospiraceae bacterium]